MAVNMDAFSKERLSYAFGRVSSKLGTPLAYVQYGPLVGMRTYASHNI